MPPADEAGGRVAFQNDFFLRLRWNLQAGLTRWQIGYCTFEKADSELASWDRFTFFAPRGRVTERTIYTSGLFRALRSRYSTDTWQCFLSQYTT